MSKLDQYNDIRSLIKTGDIFFFGGKGGFSDIIKNVTKSPYSHVGMAIWMTLPYTKDERLFIIESTTLNNVKDISGEFRRGVQIINMSQRLDGYEGDAWWAPLNNPLTLDEKVKMTAWLFQKYSSKTDYDFGQAIESGLDFKGWFKSWFRAKPNYKRLFCSELVTKALQIANRVDCSINPSEQTPEDVAEFECLGEKVKIL